MAMKELRQKKWLRMVPYLAAVVGLSFGLVYLFRYLITYFDIPMERIEEFASTAYLTVFGVTLVSNAAVFVPVAFHVSVILAAAEYWNPVIVALVASVAGTLGEITAYYAGYWGKRIAHFENTPGYGRLVGWMERYGPWGIFLVSLQPVLPVDVAGLLAGVSRLPLWRFLLPCWAGKFPKYLLLSYFGLAAWRLLPLTPP
jgi:membrane protein YqaA with SNARE-associated domain